MDRCIVRDQEKKNCSLIFNDMYFFVFVQSNSLPILNEIELYLDSPLLLWGDGHPPIPVQLWFHCCHLNSSSGLPNFFHFFNKANTLLTLKKIINTTVLYKEFCLISRNFYKVKQMTQLSPLYVRKHQNTYQVPEFLSHLTFPCINTDNHASSFSWVVSFIPCCDLKFN